MEREFSHWSYLFLTNAKVITSQIKHALCMLKSHMWSLLSLTHWKIKHQHDVLVFIVL